MSDKVTMAEIEATIDPVEFAKTHPEVSKEGYENAAGFAAKVLLGVARRDPVAFGKALDTFRAEPFSREIEALMTKEERNTLFEGRFGLTGFQWGWAVDTVAYLLEQPPVPNPAIWTITPKESR